MNKPPSRILVCLSTLLGSLACDPRSPCDPGYFEDHGACYPNPTPADAGSAEDADGLLDPSGDPYAGFGRSCTRHAECPITAPICGAPMLPICTAVNCLGDTSVCPPSWSCIDVSKLSGDPDVKSACVEF